MTRSRFSNGLLIAAVLLVGGSILVKLFGGKRYETGETARASEELFPGLEKDQIARLRIEGPEKRSVELAREGDTWTVASAGDYRADKTAVDGAVDSLLELKSGRVISRKSDNLERYDLKGENSIQVTASDAAGKVLAAVEVGKGSYNECFIKLPDESAVRKLGSDVRNKFDPYSARASGWRDKTILDAGDEDQVHTVTIVGPKDRIVFQREEKMGPVEEPAAEPDAEAADPEEGEKVDTGEGDGEPALEVKEVVWKQIAPMEGSCTKWQCDNLARSLSDLTCDKFYDGDKSPLELGLDPPAYTLIAERKDGTQVILHMGSEKVDGNYPVKLPGEDTIWLVAGYRGDYFTKAPKDYLENPPEDAKEEADAAGEEAAASGAGEAEEPAPSGDEAAAAPPESAGAPESTDPPSGNEKQDDASEPPPAGQGSPEEDPGDGGQGEETADPPVQENMAGSGDLERPEEARSASFRGSDPLPVG